MMSHPLEKSFSKYFQTVLLETEDGLTMLELKEYYADFFLPEYFVRAEIVSCKTIQGIGEKYTVYVIQVELPFTKYTVEKRYNVFLDLYKKIERNYKSIGVESMSFPSKKLFGSLTQNTIDHRKFHLNNFLIFLCQTFKKEEIVEFLEFLEIKKRLEMMKRNRMFDSMPTVAEYPEKNSRDDEQALRYLVLFNRKPKVLSKSFKEFDSYFLERRPRFSKLAIKRLFYGGDDLQGLIHLCGKFDFSTDSHFTCGNGLNLIVKLLDYEYNKDAEYYNQIFGSTSLRDMTYLYFESHIQGKGLKTCKVPALKLLHIFLNYNPSMPITQLLTGEEAIQEYKTWKLSQQTTSIKAENYNRTS